MGDCPTSVRLFLVPVDRKGKTLMFPPPVSLTPSFLELDVLLSILSMLHFLQEPPNCLTASLFLCRDRGTFHIPIAVIPLNMIVDLVCCADNARDLRGGGGAVAMQNGYLAYSSVNNNK